MYTGFLIGLHGERFDRRFFLQKDAKDTEGDGEGGRRLEVGCRIYRDRNRYRYRYRHRNSHRNRGRDRNRFRYPAPCVLSRLGGRLAV